MPLSRGQTQMSSAREGIITDEMRFVAERDSLTPEVVREESARGRLVLPANTNHLKSGLEPMCVGKVARVKINANIGNSALGSCISDELEKPQLAVECGADTVMDLSTGENKDATREAIIANSKVPVGTVPVYQAAEKVDDPNDLTAQLLPETIEHQAKQGVDYMTIHAGILLEHLPLVHGRTTGIVSRGGALTAEWMLPMESRTRCTSTLTNSSRFSARRTSPSPWAILCVQ